MCVIYIFTENFKKLYVCSNKNCTRFWFYNDIGFACKFSSSKQAESFKLKLLESYKDFEFYITSID